MTLSLTGKATPFSDGALEQAAASLRCELAAVRAVISVESAGGFLPDRRPKILFERHYFSRLTKNRFDRSHADLSQPKWGRYSGGAAEHDRLKRAYALDPEAAVRSCSWGAFQIMGDNFALCGFATPRDFIAAMVESEDSQLQAFVTFLKKRKLDDELRRLDWEGFARGYNGPSFRANEYDKKLAAAYAFHRAGGARTSAGRPLLKMGSAGPAVEELQRALGLVVDGDFGPATKKAVIRFQRSRGLVPDGCVGAGTWASLGD